ncbi:hypothetical protein BpHYR1_039147 [Brachionus plicatilis]|uniref:Uncharacterized protein n=1 Tax=Brachionus plicatilis TaxID=10195 RepID=A0A3M7RJ52_BRAPC|nr:hypothetical protein BpHYR1_039147 [Brachionus plicatilis]
MPSQIMPSLDIEKKLESIEEYEKRFLNSLENLNSSSLLKPNLKQELIKQKQGPKLDLPRPKFVSPADNRAVTSSQSRYDRIRSKSSHSRPRSRKDKNDSNLSSVESKSLNILTPVMKRSASSHSGYENSSFIFKNSLSSPMSSSHSLNSNWYKPKPLHRPNTTTSAQTKIMDSNNELGHWILVWSSDIYLSQDY